MVGWSRCRTLPPAWSQAPVVVTTSHQCYGCCISCQSVSESCSRSRCNHNYISRSLELHPRTSLTTVAFCRTLVVAHCCSFPMTCGSCTCSGHKYGDRSRGRPNFGFGFGVEIGKNGQFRPDFVFGGSCRDKFRFRSKLSVNSCCLYQFFSAAFYCRLCTVHSHLRQFHVAA